MLTAKFKIKSKVLHVARLQMLDVFYAMQNIMYCNENNVKIPMYISACKTLIEN